MTHATLSRVRHTAELAFIFLFAAFLVSLAVTLESSIGVAHHLLLIAAGTILGIGIGRRTT